MRGGFTGFRALAQRARGGPRRAPRAAALAAACGCALALAACGGGTRQDAGEPTGSYTVRVLDASFPTKQSIARQTSMSLSVRNVGSHAVPNLAITIDSFDYTSDYPELAADKRPVWAIEHGAGSTATSPPVETEEVATGGSGQTAYVNTWAFGRLAPGATRTLTWHVVPVKSGAYTVHYAIAAGLSGKAKARLESGGLAQGRFAVDIAPKPKLTHVNPATGAVEVGQFPATP